MEEEPVAVTEPQSTDDLKQLAGKEKKAAKKKLYSQQHPEPQATQRKLLKDIYIDTKDAAEKKQQLKTACFEIFDSFEGDPLLPFLDLYQRLHDVSLAKTGSLAGCYVHLFSHWMRRSPNQATIKAEYLTLETKKKALEILTAHHAHHALLVGEVFDFTEKESLDFVQNQVEAFIARKKFKEAMDLAAKFQLKPLWPLEAFLLPRVFQDALPEVREYCRDQPQLQTALLAYLDQFVFYDDAVIVAEMRKYCKEREIANCVEKITHKSLMKNIKDLIMTYELESVDRFKAPNYWWATREKSIFYTVKRRFQNATGQYPAIDHTSYVSSIKGFMEGTDEGRKRQLLNTLWNSGDQEQRKDAISWVIIFGMSRYNLPDHVARYMDNYTDEVDKIRELVMRSQLTEDLDSLTCDGIPIRIINSWPALDQILPEIAAAPFLGIDSEWKPQYLAKVDEVALLQLAFSDCVYLIDFVVLEKKLEPEQWAKFFEILLQGDGIKLGFDFINDLRAIFHNQATKEFKEMELKNRNCVCIKLLIENLIEADPDFVDFTDVSSKQLAALATTDPTETVEAVRVLSFKLSTLCEKFLGVRLDKSQQCSDWANRPLTAKQVTYAAKDAHILLQLFDVIRKQAMGKDLQFEEVMKNSMSNCSKKERTKAKKATKKKLDDLSWTEIVDKINDSAVEAYGPGIKATEFVCAVDLMLLGLGKQLRRCGADVYLPVNLADLINTCNKQTKRLILSCGKNAEGLRTQFPNRVMIVSNSNGMDPVNQLKTVFQKMRIRLHKEDIFTRCKECNTLGFIHVPAPVVQALYQSTVVCMNIYHDEPFDQEGWRKKLTDIDPQEYEGYGCRVRADPDNFQVDVNQGMVDIIRNMVIYEGGDQPIITQIKHLPENVIRPGRLFYICGTCGKFYWEGRFQENYQDKVADLIATDSAESQEAAAAVCTED